MCALLAALSAGVSWSSGCSVIGALVGAGTTRYGAVRDPDDVPEGTPIRLERKARPERPVGAGRRVGATSYRGQTVPRAHVVEGRQGTNTSECITVVTREGERCVPRSDVVRVEHRVGDHAKAFALAGLVLDLAAILAMWAIVQDIDLFGHR